MPASSWLLKPFAKPFLFALCLVPLVSLGYRAFADLLGANPAEALIRGTGEWTLRFLLLTLVITPLRRWTGQHALARFRRMLGLFAFFYAVVHLLCYGWLDMGLEVKDILHDIAKRPFILVGFVALILMVPLAVTSLNRAIKVLGAAKWQMLHRLVYVILPLGVLHFFWMKAGKNNFSEVLVYAAIAAVLLGVRIWWAWQRRIKATHLQKSTVNL